MENLSVEPLDKSPPQTLTAMENLSVEPLDKSPPQTLTAMENLSVEPLDKSPPQTLTAMENLSVEPFVCPHTAEVGDWLLGVVWLPFFTHSNFRSLGHRSEWILEGMKHPNYCPCV